MSGDAIKEGSVEFGQLIRMVRTFGEEKTLQALASVLIRKRNKVKKDSPTLAKALERAADVLDGIDVDGTT